MSKASLSILLLVYKLFIWEAYSIASTHLRKNVQIFNLLDREIGYSQAWDWQHRLMSNHIDNQNRENEQNFVGSALLLQHSNVYTLGTSTNDNSGPFSKTLSDGSVLQYDVFNVDRAGQATYHGPGQIILYPILDLNYFEKDIHLYLRGLEEVLIDTLKHFDITGTRIPGLTGVWVGNTKIAAMGVKLRRWVTLHGFSLNVHPDMRYFTNIIPCGIADKSVGSMVQFRPDVSMEVVATQLLSSFSNQFDVDYTIISGDEAISALHNLKQVTDNT
eukprot:gene2659-5219_t